MSFLVVAIINDVELCPIILESWENIGVKGVTILESTGLGHIRKAGLMEDIPLLPSLEDLYKEDEIHHRTLFSVVDTQEMADKMAEIVQQSTGNLEEPNTGFLFVVPVLRVLGMGKHRQDRSNE